jgi:hypothetical protein
MEKQWIHQRSIQPSRLRRRGQGVARFISRREIICVSPSLEEQRLNFISMLVSVISGSGSACPRKVRLDSILPEPNKPWEEYQDFGHNHGTTA